MKSGAISLPKEVLGTVKKLSDQGFKAFIVGGCVRDTLAKRIPKDWDITTDALPEDIIKSYAHTFYENTFGTVGVLTEEFREGGEEAPKNLEIIEITPFRLEGNYSDGRRPDQVSFSKDILDDLKRRDFTINAIAYDPTGKGSFIDPHGGQDDLKNRLIRAVGNPDERFKEDGLRLLRAIRIACELDFTIEEKTREAIRNDASYLKNISQERVRDEINRILMSEQPMKGFILAKELGLLEYILPEMLTGVGVEQNQAHSFDVWEHLLRTAQCSADKNYSLETRIAALLHDISKPETRRWSDEKKEWTFYGHDVVGERVAKKILERLRYSRETTETVRKLIRWHMFFSDTEQITLSAVRRMINNVGRERIWDLMNLRICDRIGTGRPKESPYRLRKYRAMIEEALRDPISVGMLKINGGEIMKITNCAPGPKIGNILHALLDEVLEDPSKNTKEYLNDRAIAMNKLTDTELVDLGKKGKENKDKNEEEAVGEIRKKHWVK